MTDLIPYYNLSGPTSPNLPLAFGHELQVLRLKLEGTIYYTRGSKSTMTSLAALGLIGKEKYGSLRFQEVDSRTTEISSRLYFLNNAVGDEVIGTVEATYSHWEHRVFLEVTTNVSQEFTTDLYDALFAQLELLVTTDDKVSVQYWALSPNGPHTYSRMLSVPTWDTIKANYPHESQSRIAQLTQWKPEEERGKLILFHGSAGTGKTSVIRTLAQEWKAWADFHCVIDPDNFFHEAFYMTNVILGNSEEGDRWRILVIEDADTLIEPEAKEQRNADLSRLLNLCDGMVGQGLRILVLMTTNRDGQKVHPAVQRPGRCIANIQFDSFPIAAANQWLQNHDHNASAVGKKYTLADLYEEFRNDKQIQRLEPSRQVGFTQR